MSDGVHILVMSIVHMYLTLYWPIDRRSVGFDSSTTGWAIQRFSCILYIHVTIPIESLIHTQIIPLSDNLKFDTVFSSV